MSASDDEIERLRGRVSWLLQWRHLISVVASAVAGTSILSAFAEGFEVDWSPFTVILLFTLLGCVIWWIVECTLAGIMAIWETKMYRLNREQSALPIARLASRWRPRRT